MWLGERDLPAARAWFAAAVAGCRPTPRRWVTSPRSTRPWAPGTPPSTACTRWRGPATTPSTRPSSPACSATPADPGGRAMAHQRGGPLRRTGPAPSGGVRRSRGRVLAHRGRGSAERAPADAAASRQPPRHRGTRTAPSRHPGRLTGVRAPLTSRGRRAWRSAVRQARTTSGARSATPTTAFLRGRPRHRRRSRRLRLHPLPRRCTTRTATTWSPTSTSPRTAGATSRARPVVALERGRPSIQVNISTAGNAPPVRTRGWTALRRSMRRKERQMEIDVGLEPVDLHTRRRRRSRSMPPAWATPASGPGASATRFRPAPCGGPRRAASCRVVSARPSASCPSRRAPRPTSR